VLLVFESLILLLLKQNLKFLLLFLLLLLQLLRCLFLLQYEGLFLLLDFSLHLDFGFSFFFFTDLLFGLGLLIPADLIQP
jgi:hypothetical protein